MELLKKNTKTVQRAFATASSARQKYRFCLAFQTFLPLGTRRDNFFSGAVSARQVLFPEKFQRSFLISLISFIFYQYTLRLLNQFLRFLFVPFKIVFFWGPLQWKIEFKDIFCFWGKLKEMVWKNFMEKILFVIWEKNGNLKKELMVN